MLRRAHLRDRVTPKLLELLYIRKGMSSPLIGTRYGVRAGAVRKLLIEYGIPRRKAGGG